MGLLSLGGAALGLAGSIFSSKKKSDAAKDAARAAQFNPWDVQGAFGGSATFDKATGQVTMNASPEQQAYYNQLNNLGSGFLGGDGFGNQFTSFAGNQIAGQMPGLFNQSQQAAAQLPYGAAGQFMGNTGSREALAMQGAGGLLGEAMQG